MKRIICVLSALLLLALLIPLSANAADTATVSVEATVVGAGYLVPPTSVEAGARASDALLRLLAENGYTAFYGGAPESAFYLAYVADGDKTGSYNGYRCASALYPVTQPKKLTFRSDISSPLKAYLSSHAGYFDETDYETNSRGYLGEFVYTDLSGWMYSLNGVFAQKDLASVTLRAGDTLRLQFTTCLGADIGGAEPAIQQAYDEAMRQTQTTAAPPATTALPPATTRAPETTAAPPATAAHTTAASPTTVPQTTTQPAQTGAVTSTDAAAQPSATPATAAQTSSAFTTEPTAPAAGETQSTTAEPPATVDASRYETGVSAEPETAGNKRNMIPIISAAAAVPVAAAVVIIAMKLKKKKETIS